jgi:hypothetical protein
MRTRKKVIIAVGVLVLVEALTFYAYSWFWLAEGPMLPDDPRLTRLNGWALVCLSAMLLELLAFLLALFYWLAGVGKAPRL